MCSTSNPLIGLSDMEEYCVRTKLLEKPSVCLYYKGMEDDDIIHNALNVIVAFTPADAKIINKVEAMKLCQRLNEDKDLLLRYGYTEFEAIKIIKDIV